MATYNINITVICCSLVLVAAVAGIGTLGTTILQKVLISVIQASTQQSISALSKSFLEILFKQPMIDHGDCANLGVHKFCPRANGSALFELTEGGLWNICYEYINRNFTADLCRVYYGCIIKHDTEICYANTIPISSGKNDTLQAILAPDHIFMLDSGRENMITWIFGSNSSCAVDQTTIGYVITELCFSA